MYIVLQPYLNVPLLERDGVMMANVSMIPGGVMVMQTAKMSLTRRTAQVKHSWRPALPASFAAQPRSLHLNASTKAGNVMGNLTVLMEVMRGTVS